MTRLSRTGRVNENQGSALIFGSRTRLTLGTGADIG